jgi:DNA-binding CsgD family transcriptional regulator
MSDFDAASRLHHQALTSTAEDELSVILEGLDEGFYAVDQTWHLRRFNRLASDYFGRPRVDVIGRGLWDLFPTAAATPLGQQFFNAMETRRVVVDRADSVVVQGRVVSFRLFPLHDGLGVAWRDVTVSEPPIHDAASDVLGFGMAELFADGRVAKANDAALTIFQRRDGFYLRDRLRAQAPVADSQFQKMIGRAAKEAAQGQRYRGHLSIPRVSAARSYVAHVSAMPLAHWMEEKPSVLLMISDADRAFSVDPGALANLFGLTASEARLVALLAEGMPLPAIARKLGIAFETARTQLASARSKTQTVSQVDLVRLLLKSFPT